MKKELLSQNTLDNLTHDAFLLCEVLSKCTAEEGLFMIKTLSLTSRWFYELSDSLKEQWLQETFKKAGNHLYRLYNQYPLDVNLGHLLKNPNFLWISRFPKWEERVGGDSHRIKNQTQSGFSQLLQTFKQMPEIRSYLASTDLTKDTALFLMLSHPLSFSFIKEGGQLKEALLGHVKTFLSQVKPYEGGFGLLVHLFKEESLKQGFLHQEAERINSLMLEKQSNRTPFSFIVMLAVMSIAFVLLNSLENNILPLWVPLLFMSLVVGIVALAGLRNRGVTKALSALEEEKNQIEHSLNVGQCFSQVAFFQPEEKQSNKDKEKITQQQNVLG